MKLVHTDEQQQLQEMLRSLFAKECPPTLVREMKQPSSEGIPPALWSALAGAGIFGLAVPTEYGGDGAELYELGLVFAEGGRVLCPSIVYTTLQFGVALNRLGSSAQKKRILPLMAGGQLRASVALWNPADAADHSPRLVAERVEAGWKLNGTLDFVPNATAAQVIMVSARTRGLSEPDRDVGFIVQPGAVGVQTRALRSMAGDKLFGVTLTDVIVDADHALPEDGGGLSGADLDWAAQAALALQCMEMVGGATAVLERTVDYIKTRHQFNRPIASFQAAQHHVADMRIALETARLSAAQAAWWIGRSEVPPKRLVAIAKMHCSEAYKWTTLTCHQLQGGMGYVRETDLHLWSERAKTTEILGGTADVAATWLQRDLGLAS